MKLSNLINLILEELNKEQLPSIVTRNLIGDYSINEIDSSTINSSSKFKTEFSGIKDIALLVYKNDEFYFMIKCLGKDCEIYCSSLFVKDKNLEYNKPGFTHIKPPNNIVIFDKKDLYPKFKGHKTYDRFTQLIHRDLLFKWIPNLAQFTTYKIKQI